MKIKLVSDLHLEFSDINITNDEGADVLILGGDIMIAQDLHDHHAADFNPYSNGALADLSRKMQRVARFRDFFKRCSFQFPHVIYIMGNHESYDYDIAKTLATVRAELAQFPNIHVMEKETIDIGDFTFVCGTLWTDMNKNDSLTLWHCGKHMNDFKLIKNGNRGISGGGYASRWSPEDSVEEHKKMVDYTVQYY